jgi:hypothetical protein
VIYELTPEDSNEARSSLGVHHAPHRPPPDYVVIACS